MKKLSGVILSLLLVISSVNFAFAEEAKYNYYTVKGKAEINEKILAKPGEVVYGKLDKHKRPTYVSATLNYELVEKERKEKREEIKVNPVGWPKKNTKETILHADGSKYTGYFYNRSHLLADSLGGSATKENLVTGTRMQNVGMKNKGGMAYTETIARDLFAKKTDITLIYQVKPIYKDNELLPRTVEVNIKSSDGKIDEKVVVDNTAYGWKIDYRTAKYTKISK